MTRFPDDIEALLGPATHDAGPAAPPPVSADLPAAGGGEMAIVGGAYDGARLFDQAVEMWRPDLGSADADLLYEKDTLDARSRDSTRNDAYVANGSNINKDSIVGAQFLLNAKPATNVLALEDKAFDTTWETEFQEEVETWFTLLAESPQCYLDAERTKTLTDMIRLAVGVYGHGGEVLSTAEWFKDGRPINTAIQMVDPDRLSTPFGKVDNLIMRKGVERDPTGRFPQTYYIRNYHPNDYGFNITFRLPQWQPVSARKPWGRQMILHVYDHLRVGQTRGVSALVTMLQELQITKKFRKVVLQNAVVQATYAASIESDLPSETVFAQLGAGAGATEEQIQGAITQYAAGYLSAINQYTSSAKNLKIDGVKIPHLFPGTKLQMRPAGPGGQLGTEFEQSLLRYIAAALGVSYEQLSKDYSQTNYSSVRAAMSETWKTMQARKRLVADKFANFAYRLTLEEAINNNYLSTLPKAKAGLFYTGGTQNLRFDAVCGAEWIGASRGQIDELKETQAAILRIQFGLSTWEDELGRLGKDWRKVFPQIDRELASAPEQVKQNLFSAQVTAATVASLGKGGSDQGGSDNGAKE